MTITPAQAKEALLSLLETETLPDGHVKPLLHAFIDQYEEALRQRDQAREEHRFALAAESAAIATLTAQRDKAVEALKWYGEQSRLARLIHSEGDAGRHALQDDGGRKAAAVVREIDNG